MYQSTLRWLVYMLEAGIRMRTCLQTTKVYRKAFTLI